METSFDLSAALCQHTHTTAAERSERERGGKHDVEAGRVGCQLLDYPEPRVRVGLSVQRFCPTQGHGGARGHRQHEISTNNWTAARVGPAQMGRQRTKKRRKMTTMDVDVNHLQTISIIAVDLSAPLEAVATETTTTRVEDCSSRSFPLMSLANELEMSPQSGLLCFRLAPPPPRCCPGTN